jgi:hypothetical protein
MMENRDKNFNWKLYEQENRKIIARNLTADEYERSMQELCERLGF